MHGRLRLLVDQGVRGFKGATRELIIDRVAHAPGLGRHNLISTRRLVEAFDAPVTISPAATVVYPRRGGRGIIFRKLRRGTGLMEIKVRRRTVFHRDHGGTRPRRLEETC